MIFRYNLKQVAAYWIGYVLFMLWFFYYNSKGRYEASAIVEGEVVEKYYEEGGRGRLGKGRSPGYEYPLYKFPYQDTFYYNSEQRPRLRRKNIGDRVRVIYLKDNPRISEIYSLVTYWVDFTKLLYSIVVAVLVFLLPRFYVEIYNDFLKK